MLMIRNRSVSIAALTSLALSMGAASSRAGWRSGDLCSLLTPAEASIALEQTSLAGKLNSPTPGCTWSHDSPASDTSRQVWIASHTVNAFNIAKRPALATIKIEAIAGLGDDAFYQVYPAPAPPFLWMKKGDKAISIRVITKWKNAPFTQEQEKAKLLVLGKAAVGRM
jgi:hypothetical protein